MDPLASLAVSAATVKHIGELDEFKGSWRALGRMAPERLSALRRIATIESVGSSTRIEGVSLSDDAVEKLLGRVAVQSFRSRDEQEVGGYAELMELIFESFAEIRLSENHIRQLHGVLLKHSLKDEHHRGHYKTLPNSVEAFDATGRSIGVVFETATPFDTPRLMEQLVTWTGTSLERAEYHPLLVIGTFIVRFLAIHPFQDGNGRLSRALTTLLLMRTGYDYVPYSSLERVVEDNKNDYYIALRRAQSGDPKNNTGLFDWLTFFVRCLVQQKDMLQHKLDQERLLAPLPPLSERVLGIVREHGRVTIRDAVALTGANRNTIKDHIQRLVDSGTLARRGRGRGTWYEKA